MTAKSSSTLELQGMKAIEQGIRPHWGMENHPHWVLDMVFIAWIFVTWACAN